MPDHIQTGSISVDCPRCGSANQLTAVSLVANELITCSKCHSALGRWDILLATYGGLDEPHRCKRPDGSYPSAQVAAE
jgi:hypothetical protein